MRLLTLFAGALITLVCVAQKDAMAKREAKVRKQLAKEKPYRAINLCNGALGSEERPIFRVLLADAHNRIGEHGAAEIDARKGLVAMPDHHEALLQLAIAEQGLGLLDSAIVHYHKVIGNKGASEINSRVRLAETYRSRKQLDLALAQMDTAYTVLSQLDDGAPKQLLRIKAEFLAEKRDTAAARAAFSAALVEQPDNPIILNSRAWFLYAAYGQHAAAIADYDRAIKQNPNYSYAFNNRGWSKFKSGDTTGALKDIDRARKKKPFNPYIYRNLGLIALQRGDTIGACSHFRRALQLNFTPVYGDEVERLVMEHCRGELSGPKPEVPSNAPDGPKRTPPPTRTNAPE